VTSLNFIRAYRVFPTTCAAAKDWCTQFIYDAVPLEIVEAWKFPQVDTSYSKATHEAVTSYVTISSDSDVCDDCSNSETVFKRSDCSLQLLKEGLVKPVDIVTIDSDSSPDSHIVPPSAAPGHGDCSHPLPPMEERLSIDSPFVERTMMATYDEKLWNSNSLISGLAAHLLPVSEAAAPFGDGRAPVRHFSHINVDEEGYASASSLDSKSSEVSSESSPLNLQSNIEPLSPSRCGKRSRRCNAHHCPDSLSVDQEKLACLMPYCETQGRVLRLDCGHVFCTSCLESQRLAKPRQRNGHYRPNLKRSKATRAHVHVRMKCALCVHPFKMSLLELSAQSTDAVQPVTVDHGSSMRVTQVSRPLHKKEPSSFSDTSVTSWKRWDLCWAKVVRSLT
jgi:hypothetical protein